MDEVKEFAKEQAEIFNIFSNEKRILIFWALSQCEMQVNEIASAVGTSAQNTSQHLRLMKGKGILTSRREGQAIFYKIAENRIGKYCRYLHKKNLEKLRKLNDEKVSP